MSHYDAGRRFEHAVRDHLRDNGFEVIRSAGSKTKVDLIGIKPGLLLFVQCKRTSRPGPAERSRLAHLAGLVGAVPVVARRPVREPLILERITGDGASPREFEPYLLDEVAA